MSKSIYEKAKGDLISLTAKFVIPNVDETDYGCIYDRCHFYNILDEQEESYLKNIEQALEQAQKQEKLLDLNKECRKLLTELRYNVLLPEYKRVEISFKIDRIEHQIKGLENNEN